MLRDAIILIICIGILGVAGCIAVDENNLKQQETALEPGQCVIRCSEEWCQPVCNLKE